MRILSIGEILWDVLGNGEEHLGGAPFNLAAHARRLGEDAIFISAVGADPRGQRALARLLELGLPAAYVQTVNTNPTGWVSVKVDSAGQPDFTIHRPAAYDSLSIDASQASAIRKWHPDWICFGTLHQMHERSRNTLETLLSENPIARRFYDVNLRPESYTPELVRRLLSCADTIKLNQSEAEEIASMLGLHYSASSSSTEQFCRTATQQCGWRVLCITLGDCGCAILADGVYAEHPGHKVEVADTIGAGDAFAAALLHGLSRAWPVTQTADFSNRVGALVASRPGAIPDWTLKEVLAMQVKSGSAGV